MSRGGRASAFERRHVERWKDFRTVASRYAKSGSVPPERIVAFARAYRNIAADLSAARAMECRPEVVRELNQLVSLGHSVVYRRRKMQAAPPLLLQALRFAMTGFPAAVWKHRRLMLVATLLFVVPAFLGYAWVLDRPPRIHQVIPDLDSVIQPGAQGAASINPMPAFFSTFLMWNNIRVAFFAFAWGLLLGVGSVYILCLNGFLLGSLAAHFAVQDQLATFWPQVAPHGVTEIGAILVASAAGMHLGLAVWRPGPWSRVDALARAGKDAATLLIGVILLLILSGFIESWFTRSVTDDALRNGFAAAMAVAVTAWIWIGAETRRREESATTADRP
ncbi:MAG: stage II sporulation protein M [Planctomycetota bacterium]